MSFSRLRKSALLALAVLLTASAGLGAQTVPPPTSLKPSGYVNDFAHVLSPQASQQLEQAAAALDQRLKVQVAMVTVTTVGDQDVFQYSYQLAQHWGVGAKTAANGQDHDTGLLIFIAVNDHKYFTQVGYGMEPYITDADVGSWMRALRPQLQARQFGVVFATMLGDIERTLAARMPGAAKALTQMPAAGAVAGQGDGRPASQGSPVPIIVFFLVIWIIGALASRGRGGMGGWLWPLLLLEMMNSGGGGYRGGGGGGFGGGGGGFGGFGGGGFGGGGAGGSW